MPSIDTNNKVPNEPEVVSQPKKTRTATIPNINLFADNQLSNLNKSTTAKKPSSTTSIIKKSSPITTKQTKQMPPVQLKVSFYCFI